MSKYMDHPSPHAMHAPMHIHVHGPCKMVQEVPRQRETRDTPHAWVAPAHAPRPAVAQAYFCAGLRARSGRSSTSHFAWIFHLWASHTCGAEFKTPKPNTRFNHRWLHIPPYILKTIFKKRRTKDWLTLTIVLQAFRRFKVLTIHVYQSCKQYHQNKEFPWCHTKN